jgi:hypothetical protein
MEIFMNIYATWDACGMRIENRKQNHRFGTTLGH